MIDNYHRLKALEYQASAQAARLTMRAAAIAYRIYAQYGERESAEHSKAHAKFYRDHARGYDEMAAGMMESAA